ncbi:ngep-related [Anaeramoeba flamelloides]|uniref:Ngep-related n=1 Tax=Anaeramoeba flamelloides TaxID=1746091 RepID=A0AAV7Y711_9EUKA|nr:ngep-related [Anaeramoeba flamelloides]KAJ6236789.1 ngep-related [Anaeramoeba flamelloides]
MSDQPLLQEINPIVYVDNTNQGEQFYVEDEESGLTFYEYIMVYPINEEDDFDYLQEKRQKLRNKLQAIGLITKDSTSSTGEFGFIHVGSSLERLEAWAELTRQKVKLSSGLEGQEHAGYQEFEIESKQLYVESSVPGCVFNSCARQKLIMSLIEAPKSKGGSQLSIINLTRKKIISQFFGLHHQDELVPTINTWKKSFRFSRPVDVIRDYFGENIAYYFAFLKLYLYFLILLSSISVAITIWQATDTKQKGQLGLWYIIIVSIWITLFIEFWKRKSIELAYHWDMLDFHQEETARPEFKGEKRESPITGKKEIYYPIWKRRIKYILTYGFTLIMMCAAAGVSISIQNQRLFSKNKQKFKDGLIKSYGTKRATTYYSMWTGAATGASIFILNAIFKTVGAKLTFWENHQTDSDHEGSLILKYFMFQSVNNYISIFISAFIAQDIGYVSTQLMSILITKQIIGNVQEVGLPWIKGKYKIRKQKKKRKRQKEEGMEVGKFKKAEKQMKFPVYENTVEDYLEMFIQLGFSTFFLLAFPLGPLAPLLSCLNNFIEIRTDAIKLKSMRRPQPRAANGIGKWMEIFKLTSVLVILSNIVMMSFAFSKFTFFGVVIDTDYRKLLWLVILEHAILFLKFCVHQAIPDVPSSVKIEIEKEEYQKEKALRKQRNEESTEDSGFSD